MPRLRRPATHSPLGSNAPTQRVFPFPPTPPTTHSTLAETFRILRRHTRPHRHSRPSRNNLLKRRNTPCPRIHVPNLPSRHRQHINPAHPATSSNSGKRTIGNALKNNTPTPIFRNLSPQSDFPILQHAVIPASNRVPTGTPPYCVAIFPNHLANRGGCSLEHTLVFSSPTRPTKTKGTEMCR